MRTIRVATCQFSVEAELDKNRNVILKQIRTAADQDAQVVHFSECALSGYAGVDIPDTSAIDVQRLQAATGEIMEAARKFRVWVLLGSTHFIADGIKPHNSVYVISPQGKIVDRYDKRFCTGKGGKRPTMDLCHYSPGNHFTTFDVAGVRCGVAICYDYRFPELYRGYNQLGVQVLLQSFHNARSTIVADPNYNIWRTIVPATMQCRAAENHFWVSANNSMAKPSRWASFVVRPDGLLVRQLKLHRPGVLITDMQLDPDLMDAPALWRASAMAGTLHSGNLIDHPRSRSLTCL